MIREFVYRDDPVRVEFNDDGSVAWIAVRRWDEINEADDEWADIVEAAHEHVKSEREHARRKA